MNNYCSEHTKVCVILGEIKGGVSTIHDDIKRLDDRINGSFERINKHIEEGDYWRSRVQAHDTKLKIYTFIFGAFNITILIALVKLFLK